MLRNPCDSEEDQIKQEEQRWQREHRWGEEGSSLITQQKCELIEDFVNVCAFHLWTSIL